MTTSWKLNEDDDIDIIQGGDCRLGLEAEGIMATRIEGEPLMISPEVNECIKHAMSEFTSKEWSAWLNRDADGIISEIYFPEQITRSATVDFEEDTNGEYEGFLHSHHSMGISFSGTDEEEVNSSFKYSILVKKPNDTIEYEAVRKAKLSSGDFIVAECDVNVAYNQDIEWFKEQVEENTKEPKQNNIGYNRLQHYPKYNRSSANRSHFNNSSFGTNKKYSYLSPGDVLRARKAEEYVCNDNKTVTVKESDEFIIENIVHVGGEKKYKISAITEENESTLEFSEQEIYKQFSRVNL